MSQPSDEQVGQCLSAGVMAMDEVQAAASRNVQPGQTDASRGCLCGGCPNLDRVMARTAWGMFNGLDGGLQHCGNTNEPADPTNADLKCVKDCIEHFFEAHKERFEISPGTYFDRKEARGYLLGAHLGRGLLASAQYAHDVGVQLATMVGRAETEAGTAAATARRKAARRGEAAGPGGPREKAAQDAADAIWARPARLPSLPQAELCIPPRKKRAKTPATSASDAHRPVGLLPEDGCTLQFVEQAVAEVAADQGPVEIDPQTKAILDDIEARYAREKAEREAWAAEQRAEREEAEHRAQAEVERIEAAAYRAGWEARDKKAKAEIDQLHTDIFQIMSMHSGIERRYEHALRKAGIDPEVVIFDGSESESESECSE